MRFSNGGYRRHALSLAALGAAAVIGATSALAADEVNVRFSWKLKGEYAPFFHAQSSGGFESRDLAVALGEGAGSQAALGALIQGQDDVVIMPAIFAISAIQRGMPVKLIALYHPKTPVVLISHPEKPITTPADLEGKKLATAVGETGTSYMDSFCDINAIDCGKIEMILMDRGARMPQFLQGEVDAVSVYLSNDLPLIQEKTGVDYPILDLGKYGLAAPGMSVVTSESLLEEKADVLSRFLDAVHDSIMVTKESPAVAAQSLSDSWDGAPDIGIITEQVQATVEAMQIADDKPAGWINADDLQATLDMLEAAGEIEEPKAVSAFYTNDLLAQ